MTQAEQTVEDQALPPEPVNVVDGIPDRAAHRPLWKYLVLVGVFLAWLGVLIGLFLAGKVA